MARSKKAPAPEGATAPTEIAANQDAGPQPVPSGITTLPLSVLLLSDLNVRTTERDADIAALADDIAARGLKQNLVVVPAHFTTSKVEETEGTNRWDGKFEVIAGGRRFQAMKLLAADGRLPEDHPVPVLIEDRAEASETSLSENLHKVAMNPADEFAAFKAIVDQRKKAGDSETDAIAYTAKRFGVAVNHVQGRLRLADAAPEILDALRANRIGIDAAKAYATTADHDLQRKVFALIEKDSWRSHNARDIRTEIRGKTLPLDAPLVQFVGLVTYQAEGGRIESEMFMGENGQQRLVDVALLERLARKIADAAIPALAKADGVQSGVYATGVGHNANWPKPPKGFVKAWEYGGEVKKADLKKSVGVYAIKVDPEDGTVKLARIGRFKPDVPVPAQPQRDWEAERRQREREELITTRAARMVMPATVGTPFEGLAYWPKWNPIEECDDDNTFVVMLIKVSNAEIAEKIDEAARLIDEEAVDAADADRQLAKDFPDHVKPVAEEEDDGADELVTDEAEG